MKKKKNNNIILRNIIMNLPGNRKERSNFFSYH